MEPVPAEAVDLREEPASHVLLAALTAVRELRPGRACLLLTREDPALLMASLNLQLREALAWQSAECEGSWQTTVHLALDTAPRDVIDILVRDHRRLDALLGRALRRLNAADPAAARPMLEEFAAGLRRHAAAENELIAPALAPAPVDDMLREHGELLEQLGAVEDALAHSPEAWELEALAALLSALLAKHEQREEGNLFPVWRARLESLGAASAGALQAKVREAFIPDLE